MRMDFHPLKENRLTIAEIHSFKSPRTLILSLWHRDEGCGEREARRVPPGMFPGKCAIIRLSVFVVTVTDTA